MADAGVMPAPRIAGPTAAAIVGSTANHSVRTSHADRCPCGLFGRGGNGVARRRRPGRGTRCRRMDRSLRGRHLLRGDRIHLRWAVTAPRPTGTAEFLRWLSGWSTMKNNSSCCKPDQASSPDVGEASTVTRPSKESLPRGPMSPFSTFGFPTGLALRCAEG